MNRDEVASPCNRICRLDAAQVCIGCGRHVDEIAVWSGAGREQRLQICARAAARLAAMNGRQSSIQTPERPP